MSFQISPKNFFAPKKRFLNKIAFKTQKLFLDEISIFKQNKLLLEEVHIKKSQSLGLAFFMLISIHPKKKSL